MRSGFYTPVDWFTVFLPICLKLTEYRIFSLMLYFSVDRVTCLDGEAVFHLNTDSSFARAANGSAVAVMPDGMDRPVSGCLAVLAPGDITRPVFFNFSDCGVHVVDIQVIQSCLYCECAVTVYVVVCS